MELFGLETLEFSLNKTKAIREFRIFSRAQGQKVYPGTWDLESIKNQCEILTESLYLGPRVFGSLFLCALCFVLSLQLAFSDPPASGPAHPHANLSSQDKDHGMD